MLSTPFLRFLSPVPDRIRNRPGNWELHYKTPRELRVALLRGSWSIVHRRSTIPAWFPVDHRQSTIDDIGPIRSRRNPPENHPGNPPERDPDQGSDQGSGSADRNGIPEPFAGFAGFAGIPFAGNRIGIDGGNPDRVRRDPDRTVRTVRRDQGTRRIPFPADQDSERIPIPVRSLPFVLGPISLGWREPANP